MQSCATCLHCIADAWSLVVIWVLQCKASGDGNAQELVNGQADGRQGRCMLIGLLRCLYICCTLCACEH
jgi:hypothetical protein